MQVYANGQMKVKCRNVDNPTKFFCIRKITCTDLPKIYPSAVSYSAVKLEVSNKIRSEK